jgi:adenylosuccinate lyase
MLVDLICLVWSEASERYRTRIGDIFSAENKLRLQLKIEVELAQVQSELGLISAEEAEKIHDAANQVTLSRVQQIEREISHDLMAMVKALAEQAGAAGEKVHLGATSNDIQDTVLALQLTAAKSDLLDILDLVSEELVRLSQDHKSLACIGRTHGQHAVPTTVGFKFANYLYELQLAKDRLHNTKVSLSKFSGAVGNYASSHRLDIEKKVLERLELQPVAISTQVVSRVLHADFLNAMALCAGVLERISKEIRNLQRSEIGEWSEPFSEKQVGSSAMPHKRNPHKSERVSGISRIIRGNVAVALENIALEHERDISHSSVERIIIPESSNLLYYIGSQMQKILNSLTVHEDAVSTVLQSALGRASSEQILKLLVDKVGRQEGHELLRKHATEKNYRESIMQDNEILNHVSKAELVQIFEKIDVGLAVEKVELIVSTYESTWKTYRSTQSVQ